MLERRPVLDCCSAQGINTAEEQLLDVGVDPASESCRVEVCFREAAARTPAHDGRARIGPALSRYSLRPKVEVEKLPLPSRCRNEPLLIPLGYVVIVAKVLHGNSVLLHEQKRYRRTM